MSDRKKRNFKSLPSHPLRKLDGKGLVDRFDVAKYEGKWYEIARKKVAIIRDVSNKIVETRQVAPYSAMDSKNVTATYKLELLPQERRYVIRVTNTEQVPQGNGFVTKSITGIATPRDIQSVERRKGEGFERMVILSDFTSNQLVFTSNEQFKTTVQESVSVVPGKEPTFKYEGGRYVVYAVGLGRYEEAPYEYALVVSTDIEKDIINGPFWILARNPQFATQKVAKYQAIIKFACLRGLIDEETANSMLSGEGQTKQD